MARSRPTRTVDGNLVRQLQMAVSGSIEPPRDEQLATDPQELDNGTRAAPKFGSMPDHGSSRKLVTMNRPAAFSARVRRTTLSVPTSVGEKARQLTMAITVAEQQDGSLGQTLSWALDLLEAELRKKDVPIGDRPVRLRSGPRDRD